MTYPLPSEVQGHELRDALARVQLRYPAIPTELFVDGGVATLIVRTLVPDRETGTHVLLDHRFPIPEFTRDGLEDFIPWVCGVIRRVWGHELDESLHLDGARIAEPHPHPFLSVQYRPL